MTSVYTATRRLTEISSLQAAIVSCTMLVSLWFLSYFTCASISRVDFVTDEHG
jgi:hypothetical protein